MTIIERSNWDGWSEGMVRGNGKETGIQYVNFPIWYKFGVVDSIIFFCSQKCGLDPSGIIEKTQIPSLLITMVTLHCPIFYLNVELLEVITS